MGVAGTETGAEGEIVAIRGGVLDFFFRGEPPRIHDLLRAGDLPIEFATLEWVDWFNNRRLLEPIGNIPPAEAEANFYADTEEFAMVA